ncbi:hypothetical protein [Deinococcus marmoris]|uniref:Uncharacterized protein n=1 Tax=Deinococcus marmoris TaxID=249408 RepID=A0A1U7NVM1_9DEIO|nr:hypothetical protein [Deinococcus marmoris]OLV16965.1 hypothetical protein BOO71_0010264 [Deinococcus marmoris]
MDDDQWIDSGLCTVSAARVEQVRVWLEQVMRRRPKLDAWEMEGQVLRDARMDRHRNHPLQGRA